MLHRPLSIESLEDRRLLSAAEPWGPASQADTLLRYLSGGDLLWASEGSSGVVTQHWPATKHTSAWRPVLAGDFSGDGLPDVFGQLGDEAWIQVNDGRQLFLMPWGEGLPESAEILGTGDVNGDGLLDIVSYDNAAAEVWVAINNRDQGFRREMWANWLDHSAVPLMVGDANQDGLTDILGAFDGAWQLGRSDGAEFHQQAWGPFPDFNWREILHGHFNEDRHLDVVARAPDNTWWLWAGTDDGLRAARYWGHWKMASDWYDVQVADFDADGLDDIIGRTEAGELWVASSTSTGFHTWRWATGWVHSADWQTIEIADLDGDGLLDQVGQARDGTWWLAKNAGDGFRNEYLGRLQEEVELAVVVDAFATDEEQPVFQQLLGRPTPLPKPASEPLRISVDASGQLVAIGSGQRLKAIEFQSASGSLISIPADGALVPFETITSNDPTKIRLTTATPLEVNGEIALGIQWNAHSAARDLVVSYDLADVAAIVDQSLFSTGTSLDNAQTYASFFQTGDVAALPGQREPDEAEGAPTAEPEPLAIEGGPDPLGTHALAITIALGDDGTFALLPSDATAHLLRIESPTGSLVPGTSPAPFEEFLVNDRKLVVLASEQPVSFVETVQLDLAFSAASTDRLMVEYANTASEWFSANLFGERMSERRPPEPLAPSHGRLSETPIIVTLDAMNNLVISGVGQFVPAINLMSESGGLRPGTSPEPFSFFLASNSQQVTLATWGTYVQIDGNLTLDVAWNSESAANDLVVEYGGPDAELLFADVRLDR